MRTSPGRTSRTWAFATVTLAGALLAPSGCKSKDSASGSATNKPVANAVAHIGDAVITVDDVQSRMNKQPAFLRAKYKDPKEKQALVDNMIRLEVMAQEAHALGYDRDPDVLAQTKQLMISKYLQKDFEAGLKLEDVPQSEVEAYFRDHAEQYSRTDQIRVCQIMVKDKAKAARVAAQAHA
ncbi:MAG: hypothetical protein ABUL67_00525, partial [Haliangium ochraceum]